MPAIVLDHATNLMKRFSCSPYTGYCSDTLSPGEYVVIFVGCFIFLLCCCMILSKRYRPPATTAIQTNEIILVPTQSPYIEPLPAYIQPLPQYSNYTPQQAEQPQYGQTVQTAPHKP